MGRQCWQVLCVVVVLAAPAGARADRWVRPALGTQFGTTDFDLSLDSIEPSGDDVTVRSLLEWPVDVVLIGVDFGLALPSRKTRNSWLFEGRFETNIGDARGSMEDSDWISSSTREVPPVRFAYTRSETETRAFLIELSGGYRFERYLRRYDLAIDALMGARTEIYAMTALGARGQYFGEDVEIPSDVRAADYDVVHVLPFVGSRLLYRPLSRQLEVSLLLRAHYLYSHSHDDHLLRNKDAFGRAHGYGLSAALAPAFLLSKRVGFGVSVEAYYLEALRGTLEQEFYADDPGTPEDETRSAVPDANFRVKSARLQIMAFTRLSF